MLAQIYTKKVDLYWRVTPAPQYSILVEAEPFIIDVYIPLMDYTE